MGTTIVYVAIVEDRHFGTDVRLFASREAAVEDVEKILRTTLERYNAQDQPVSCELDDAMGANGWVWYGYTCDATGRVVRCEVGP